MAAPTPPYQLKKPLVPIAAAEAITTLLLDLHVRSKRGQATDSLALKIVLADLQHCLDLAFASGRQLSAKKWESLARRMRVVIRGLDSQSHTS